MAVIEPLRIFAIGFPTIGFKHKHTGRLTDRLGKYFVQFDWSDVQVGQPVTSEDGAFWRNAFSVWRLPKTPGGMATVEVSQDGEVLRMNGNVGVAPVSNSAFPS
jgi:hypothetical protein